MDRNLHRHRVLFAAAVAVFVTGATMAFSIFRNPLMAEHGWSASEVTLAWSLNMLATLLGVFLIGPLQKRFRPSVLTLVGGVLQGTGFFLVGFAQSLPALYLSFALVAGPGAGILYGGSVGAVTRWYPDKVGLANGICLGATGLAPLFYAPFGEALVANLGVDAAFNAIGAFMFVLVLATFWMIKLPPAGWLPYGWEPEESSAQEPHGREFSVREMLATPLYWTMLVTLVCVISCGTMLVGQVSAIAQFMLNVSSSDAALITGVLAVYSFAGRLGAGALSDKIGRFNMCAILAAFAAADLLFFFNGALTLPAFLFALAFPALCYGGVMAMIPGLASDNFGRESSSVNYPFLYCSYTASSFVGPLVASTCLEQTGTYELSVYIVGALALASLAGFVACKRLARRQ